jgi:hypothetical protein
MVAHACNPSCLGSGDRGTVSSSPTQAELDRPYLKNKYKLKKGPGA